MYIKYLNVAREICFQQHKVNNTSQKGNKNKTQKILMRETLKSETRNAKDGKNK